MSEQRSVRLSRTGHDPSISATLETVNGEFVLQPETWVERPQQIKVRSSSPGSIAWDSGSRSGTVADFQPRPLWGVEGGEPFTVLEARMSLQEEGCGLPSQVYTARSILRGAHIEGRETVPAAVRVAFSLPWAGWGNDEPVSLEQGRLSPWTGEDGPGLVWEPARPHTVHDLTQRFPPILTALFQLWTGMRVDVCAIEVRIEGAGWCTVESIRAPSVVRGRPFLGFEKLTLEMVSCWLAKAQRLGPSPFIAIGDKGPLQSEAQMLATALEGLHRRLHPHASRFHPPVPRRRLDHARKQARRAAADALDGTVDAATAKKVYGEALAHVEEPSYIERLAELLPRIERTAPGLLGPSVSEWIEDMKDLRNIQSHGLPDHDDFGETEISRYYVMASSGRWVLKLLLLLEIMDDEESIRSALRDSDRFMYALANVDREGYWPNFSAYHKFLVDDKAHP